MKKKHIKENRNVYLWILAVTLWLPVLQIAGNSMFPALREGEIVVCIRDGTPEPGELVSFYLGNKLLVKRCIAGSGQQVEITEAGQVLVDGNVLTESYVAALARGEGDVQYPCVVPEGQFFCLGDKRDTSVDSRHSAVGFVSREYLRLHRQKPGADLLLHPQQCDGR